MLKNLNRLVSSSSSIKQSINRSYSTHATKDSWDRLVKNSSKPVVVDFYANWCAPCRTLAPALEKAIIDFGNVDLVKVNIDDEPSLAEKHNISSIPHVVGFKNGNPIFQFTGAIPPPQIKKYLDNFKSDK